MPSNKYYLGIDLGGTCIKGGIIDSGGNILISLSAPTEFEKGADGVIANINTLIGNLLSGAGLTLSCLYGIGLGIPGMIDSAAGVVVYSNNIRWDNVEIVKKIRAVYDTKIAITNDANAAALGEAKFGAGKDFTDSVFITLGTGVGGGIVIGGKIFAGNKSAGAEIGHIILKADGESCTCGLNGCFEAYSSATALIRDTRRALEKDESNPMWQSVKTLTDVNAKLAFEYEHKDAAAKKIVDDYIKYLGLGLISIVNLLRPEAIMLGGGVSNEGENLTARLQAMVDSDSYGGSKGPRVQILTARLKNNAGFMGAAMLNAE